MTTIFHFSAETPAKNDKPTTSTPSQNNNQQRRGQKRKLKEDEPFVVHENGKLDRFIENFNVPYFLRLDILIKSNAIYGTGL